MAKVPWKLCVVCADDASYQYMRREGIPCIKAETGLPDFGYEIVRFGTGNFQRLNLLKLRLLNTFAKDERLERCIYLDGDIAVYKDFVPDILERLEECPLLFQCNEGKDAVCSSVNCTTPCTGFICWKKGADGGIFNMNNLEQWREKPEDQVWVGKKLKEYDIKYKSLPRELYPNGTLVSLFATDKKDAFLLHYNYRVGQSKVADMKKNGDWFLVI